MDTAQSTMDTAHSTMHTAQLTMDTAQLTIDTSLSTMDTSQSTMDTAQLLMDTCREVFERHQPEQCHVDCRTVSDHRPVVMHIRPGAAQTHKGNPFPRHRIHFDKHDVLLARVSALQEFQGLLKAMVDKKRGVKANCANEQEAREVTAQRRAAEAAGPIEIGAQAGVIAAEAQAQADAGADEADAQLHQLLGWVMGGMMERDGCASQFKGAKAIRLHWHLANRFGVPVQWSYGATSHFKSTHDSEGGVIKREWM
ncbi:hypothetical protein QJQ45_015425 [Haematococcus lacustris]|nr:hypothetical protein QJQ45_015425 [Haematococcus lacustris]